MSDIAAGKAILWNASAAREPHNNKKVFILSPPVSVCSHLMAAILGMGAVRATCPPLASWQHSYQMQERRPKSGRRDSMTNLSALTPTKKAGPLRLCLLPPAALGLMGGAGHVHPP